MAKKNSNTKSRNSAPPGMHKEKAASKLPAAFSNPYIYLGICLTVTLICYLPALFNGWTTWDDEGYVYGNEMVKHLSFSTLPKFFSTYQMGNYHPFPMLSLGFDYLLYHMHASGFHIHSVLLHLVNVVLVFFFIRLLTDKLPVAFITALFFGIHPEHIESVSWISERKDLLYVLYYLAALITYLKYVKTDRKSFFYSLTIILFIFSLFSKGQAVTFPVVLILIDYYLKRPLTGKVWVEKVPLFLLSLLFGIISLFAQKSDSAFRFKAEYSFVDRLFFSTDSFTTYFYKSLLPFRLSAYYPYPILTGGHYSLFTLISPIIFFAIAGLVIYSMKRGRIIVFGFTFFLVNVILILQLLPVGGAVMADRYSYLSYIGLFFIMGMGVQWLLDNSSAKYAGYKMPAMVLVVAFAIFFSVKTFARNHIWKSDETLFADMLDYSSYIPEANYGLGTEYQKQGKNDLAVKYLSAAINMAHDYAEPAVRRFYIYTKAGNIDSAIIDYNHVMELEQKRGAYHYIPAMSSNLAIYCKEFGKPNLAVKYFSEAISFQQPMAEALVGRSDSYRQEGKIDSAIIDCNHALQLDANNSDAYMSRGIALCIANRFDSAMHDFNNAIRIDPKNAKAYGNRGNLFDIKQKYDSAIADYGNALKYDSTYIEVYGNRSITYMKKGMTDEAINDLNLAIQHSPNNPENYVARSQAYIKKGNYQQALNDLLAAQSKGQQVNPAYIDMLKGKIAGK